MFGDEASLYNLEDVQAQDLGQVGEVVITKDDTLFMKVRIHGNSEQSRVHTQTKAMFSVMFLHDTHIGRFSPYKS